MPIPRLLISLLLVACALLWATSYARAQTRPTDPVKRVHILQLMSTMQMQDNAKVMMGSITQALLQNLRQRKPGMSEEQIAGVVKITEEVFAENFDSFNELMVHLYDKHYSGDDIEQLQAFFESPVGKKMIAVTPSFSRESFQIGAEWGQLLQPQIDRRVRELLKPAGNKS